jgi:hypothetical protein
MDSGPTIVSNWNCVAATGQSISHLLSWKVCGDDKRKRFLKSLNEIEGKKKTKENYLSELLFHKKRIAALKERISADVTSMIGGAHF